MSRTVAYVASGSKNNKLLFIVADKEHTELREFILRKLDRTATVMEIAQVSIARKARPLSWW